MLVFGAGVLMSVGILAMLRGLDIEVTGGFGRVRGNKTFCLSPAEVGDLMKTAEEELLEFAPVSTRVGVTGTVLPLAGINKV